MIIFLVARNFSKPLKIKLESVVFNESAEWVVDSWDENLDYILVGDTLGSLSSGTVFNEPLISIYEGKVVSEA